jgi:hypothetical protein
VLEGMRKTTNEYARQYILQYPPRKPNSRLSKWKSLKSKELHIFLVILLHTNCNRKSKLKYYWKLLQYVTDPITRVGHHISLRRFELIWKVFTVSSSSLGDDSGTPLEFCLAKKKKKRQKAVEKI